MRVNYEKHTYCSLCMEQKPLGLIRCPDCSTRLRYKRHNKNTYYARVTKPTWIHIGNAGKFKKDMQQKWIERVEQGLDPEIPV